MAASPLSSPPPPQSITNLTGFPVECASLPPAWQVDRSWLNDQVRPGALVLGRDPWSGTWCVY